MMRRMSRRLAAGMLVAAVAVVGSALTARSQITALEGRAGSGGSVVPAVEAAFAHESYRPNSRARLIVSDPSRQLVMQTFRSGPELDDTTTDDEMQGVPVTRRKIVERLPGVQPLSVPVGSWESGLYFIRLEAEDGRVGFAPFIVAPRRIGVHRVAVVLPTLTWQAYNFRDDDGDGSADSWYAEGSADRVRLGRAHLDRGVPYGFRYHLGFHKWLHWSRKQADYLSQWDLEQVASSDVLAREYDLLVFAGHHEYVTAKEYDLVEGFRDRGGNLMFLSANNFFGRVERKGRTLVRLGRWRDHARPEAALVGVQYTAHRREPRAPWIARYPARSWPFGGTGLRSGSRFARGGVEIDHVTSASPNQIQILAEIPDLFGPGKTAQMTYYETTAGARVFAAGAFHLTRGVTSDFVVWRLLENLWARLAAE